MKNSSSRKRLSLYAGETTSKEDLIIGCIDDLQKEIDELRVQLISLQAQQQPIIRTIGGYHDDIEKFYTEEK